MAVTDHFRTLIFALSCAVVPHAVFAQEAYIGQVGTQNTAANVDFAAKGRLVTAQIGKNNSSALINATGSNLLASVQIGSSNQAAGIASGTGNTVVSAQLGFGHTALSLVRGNATQVTTLQQGMLNRSQIALQGSGAGVNVSQSGMGLQSNLNVSDSFVRTMGRNASATGLNVGVNQNPGDPAVNATVTRDAAGTITVRPGSATTVLKLSG
jgi:hypothetical protein